MPGILQVIRELLERGAPPRQAFLPGLEGLANASPMPRPPDSFGVPIEQLLRPIRQTAEPFQLELPLEPPSDFWGIPSKDLLPKKQLSLDEHLQAIERVARGGSLGSTERVPVQREVPGIVPRGPSGLTPSVTPDPANLPLHLQELERITHEVDPGVLQEPSLLLNEPLSRILQQSTQLQRGPGDIRVNRLLRYLNSITDMFARSGLPEEEIVEATDSLSRLGSRVRSPLEGASDVESGMGVDDAMAVLKDVRRRLEPQKLSGQERNLLHEQIMLRSEMPRDFDLDAMKSSTDPEVLGRVQAIEQASERLGEISRIRGASKQQRAREASELLKLVSATRSGGDISDFTGEARSGGILRSNAFAERQEKGRQIRGIVRSREREGRATPSDKRLSQYQLNPIRMPLQYENIPDPESVRGIRAEVSDDPFENVLSGQSRSVIRDLSEVRKLGLQVGKPVVLQSGDGRMVRATVVALKNASPSSAAETGLRTGYTPKSAAELITQRIAKRAQPQVEVVFKPVGQTRPGLEDDAVVGPLAKMGTEAATEARAGVGTANPRVELGLSEAQLQDLASKGYTKFRDELSFPKTRQKGSPYAIMSDTGEEAIEVFPAAEGAPARFGRILKGAQLKNQLRQKTMGELRMQHRDTAQLGQGPSTEATARTLSARPDDRRDLEFRPTSVGKDVTDPKEAINILRGKEVPKGTSLITEHWQEKYPSRTYFNAQNSDVTLAIAADFSSGGERMTRNAAGAKYVPVESFQEFLQGKDSAVSQAVARINKAVGGSRERKRIILNIAGNGLNTLQKRMPAATQAMLNEKMAQFLEKIANHPGRGFEIGGVISGGQTGMDEAGIMAARKLGIPNAAVLPKKYQIRETKSGVDIWTDRELQKRRFAGEDISQDLEARGAEAANRLAQWKKNNPQK